MKRSFGYLEIIAGPMYSGKTEELIRQVKRAVIGKRKVQVFKHALDTRYGTDNKIFSHAGITIRCEVIRTPEEIPKKIHPSTDMIALDEAQWFGDSLIPIVQTLLEQKISILIAGLSMTFDRQPFFPIPTLMALADKVTKLSAVCSICGQDAVFHKRIAKAKTSTPASLADPTLVGKRESYEARCRNCYVK